jgi:hypothetical protein
MFGSPPGAVDRTVSLGACPSCTQAVGGIVRYQLDNSALSVTPDGAVRGNAKKIGAIFHHECQPVDPAPVAPL